jgi:ketosteroid isomerase-like protein
VTAGQDLLRQAYAAYSAQDLDGLLAMVSDDVDWPDGAGGRLTGKTALRSYWVVQWTHTRTHDEPAAFTDRPDGTVEVFVDQVVRSLSGSVVSTGSFRHLLRIEGAQISRLDVEAAP